MYFLRLVVLCTLHDGRLLHNTSASSVFLLPDVPCCIVHHALHSFSGRVSVFTVIKNSGDLSVVCLLQWLRRRAQPQMAVFGKLPSNGGQPTTLIERDGSTDCVYSVPCLWLRPSVAERGRKLIVFLPDWPCRIVPYTCLYHALGIW